MIDRKIFLLIVFLPIHVGGATTSLMNLLQEIDYAKYDVDLLLYEAPAVRDPRIPLAVHVLPQASVHRSMDIKNLIRKGLSPAYVHARLQAAALDRKGLEKQSVQVRSRQGARYSRPILKEYDIAVAYELNWPLHYVANRVRAQKKLVWLHLDYDKSGLEYQYDRKSLEKMDCVVVVSQECLDSFVRYHPLYRSRCFYMPNLISSRLVRIAAEEDVADISEFNGLTLISVCRIDFPHKGIDRGVRAFAQLRREGLLQGIRWIIVGDGPDQSKLDDMLCEEKLQNVIHAIGGRINPIPYLKKADVFFLPSHFEGKPMAVTEAQIIGLVPYVTEYSSAREQVRDQVDGRIMPNTDEGICNALREMLSDPSSVVAMKASVQSTEYGNIKEIERFDRIMDEILS